MDYTKMAKFLKAVIHLLPFLTFSKFFFRKRVCLEKFVVLMSPPLLGVEEEGQSDVSSPPVECISQNDLGLKERNYLGLSDCSSVNISGVSSFPEGNSNNLNLKATELRLGLPGSQSPERDADLCLLKSGKPDEKPLFPLLPSKDGICSSSQKGVVSGYKRGFSDTMDGLSPVKGSLYTEKDWMFCGAGSESQPVGHGNSGVNVMSARSSGVQASVKKDGPVNAQATNVTNLKQAGNSNLNISAPAAKAQVLFLSRELSSALGKMFSCFTLGPCGSHGASGTEISSESKWKDLSHGSEYVLTYEDKDGDWMLVGDVPWEMFIETCKRLKIMKSTDANGLAPRATEKSKIDHHWQPGLLILECKKNGGKRTAGHLKKFAGSLSLRLYSSIGSPRLSWAAVSYAY
ncbi:hypothetical protein V6N13_112188 [Hibiscus sabdariffa]